MNNISKPKIVAVSGGFDPIHIGHVRMFNEAKKLGDKLVVIINNDNWLMKKKGKIFMPQEERAEIIKSIKSVDDVLLTRHLPGTEDMSVSNALKELKPDIFANGGDRDEKNAADPKSSLYADINTCKEIGCEMIFNVGQGGKVQSSSWLLSKWNGQ
jgi:D-beta-D-heptose 7-phosphate kinase/D-beta-D-heptose 1-phosphate adenosyltransferase